MTELYHLGVPSTSVPASIVLIDSELMSDAADIDGWQPLAARREYFNGVIDGILICAGAYGAPATVIAMEELVRAGARQCVALASCHCERCSAGDHHRSVIAAAAVRGERISADYAPPEFPAVPSHQLLEALRRALPNAEVGVVRTVDVPPRPSVPLSVPLSVPALAVAAVDLVSSPVFVVGAARGIHSASVVLCSGARQEEIAATLSHVIKALRLTEGTDALS